MNKPRSKIIRFFLPAVIVVTVAVGINAYYRATDADQMGFLFGDYSTFIGTTIFFISFVAIIQFFLRRGSRGRYDKYDAYFAEEREANLARKREIDDSHMVKASFPESACIGKESSDTQLFQKQERARTASQQVMMKMNLSNIQLKKAFGPQNIDYIASCEVNFNSYVQALTDWAEGLLYSGNSDAARSVLEEAVNVGADTSRVFRQLAELYHKGGKSSKLNELLTKTQDPAFLANDLVTKSKIQAQISGLIN